MAKKSWKFSRLGVLVLFLLHENLIFLCCSLNDEGLALLKLRERIVSDPYGALKNWKESVDLCSWFGVECSDGNVVALNLKNLRLGGTLAPELKNLTHIKSIILRNNSFTGIIPDGIGALKELEVLDFGYNNFSGPLPPDLGSNISLTILPSPDIHGLKILTGYQAVENEQRDADKGLSSTWDVAQTDNAVQKRQLMAAGAPPPKKSVSSNTSIRLIRFMPLMPRSPPSGSDPRSPSVVYRPPPANTTENVPVEPPLPAPNANSPSVNNSTSFSAPIPPPSYIPESPVRSSSQKNHQVVIIVGSVGGTLVLLFLLVTIYLCHSSKAAVKPWATGLSGQLRKAFITGVQKLKRSELEVACEDFSNVIGSSPIGTLYKGTLSSGVEIAVASVGVTSAKDWSTNLELQFRKKIETLSKVNHKNFVNLLAYCEEEEPFTRMMVFEYASNGTLFGHLHFKEFEHLDWGMRLRIAMGMAYCLEHMHQLNPPIAHTNLNSSAVCLTEDYAAKVSEFSFSNWTEFDLEASGKKVSGMPSADPESNVYAFGVLLFEMVTGRLPYSVDNVPIEDWASDYLRGDQPLKEIIDPTLASFEEGKLESIGEVLKSCVHPNPEQRPTMREVTARLKEITGIAPDGAIPKLSPLWWAELEIASADGS